MSAGLGGCGVSAMGLNGYPELDTRPGIFVSVNSLNDCICVRISNSAFNCAAFKVPGGVMAVSVQVANAKKANYANQRNKIRIQ